MANAPSHVSDPEYDALSVAADVETDVADAFNVALHAGVGSPSAPAAKNNVIVNVDPVNVPLRVPLLLRWQELHDPSLGSTAFVFTVPETLPPFCVSCHETVAGPCESVAMPDQLPLRSAAADVVGGGDGTVAGADGVAEEPQLPDTTAATHSEATSVSGCMETPRPASPFRFIRV